MAVYKDKWNGYKGNTWRVACYYKDWKGERKKHDKRGFHTKREALAYEREFLAKTSKDIHMGFDTFVDIYLGDLKPRIKPTTLETKESIINTHIIPYFKQMSLAEITATDILQWQNSMLSLRDDNGKGYSQTYLRSVHNQLNAIFNHAVRYYDLPKNPCRTNKKMGKAKTGEMKFWTGDEYSRFSKAMVEKPLSYYAFELLYWTGIRCGELLALTRADFDLDNRKLRINKNFQVVKGKPLIQSPKTEKGNRIIDLPEFLCREMEDFFESIYKMDENSRLFEVTKSYLHHELDRGCRQAGVKRIRLHDLRHSHVSYLINLGFSAVAIGDRVGHESVTITDRYSHLFPSVQKQMAEKLDESFNQTHKKEAENE